MFTGIVQSQAAVISINMVNNVSRLKISLDNSLVVGLKIGASVAINGVCLTTVDFGKFDEHRSFICFDVIDETLKVSNLSTLALNSSVNIERSLQVGDEIGGHLVSGHVHCLAKLVEQHRAEDNCVMYFQCDEQWMKYIMEKGFITINGTSLTVGRVLTNKFSVHLIPETHARTNLGALCEGDQVNLEFDQQTITIVTTIERMKTV